MYVVGVTELGARGVDQLATEDEVKALCHLALLHSEFAAKLAHMPRETRRIV
jgi:hypothetical protein